MNGQNDIAAALALLGALLMLQSQASETEPIQPNSNTTRKGSKAQNK